MIIFVEKGEKVGPGLQFISRHMEAIWEKQIERNMGKAN